VRDDPGRLRDILDAIDRVEQYVEKGREEFEQNELLQIWIVHDVQIIGEAARGLRWVLEGELHATSVSLWYSLVVRLYLPSMSRAERLPPYIQRLQMRDVPHDEG